MYKRLHHCVRDLTIGNVSEKTPVALGCEDRPTNLDCLEVGKAESTAGLQRIPNLCIHTCVYTYTCIHVCVCVCVYIQILYIHKIYAYYACPMYNDLHIYIYYCNVICTHMQHSVTTIQSRGNTSPSCRPAAPCRSESSFWASSDSKSFWWGLIILLVLKKKGMDGLLGVAWDYYW